MLSEPLAGARHYAPLPHCLAASAQSARAFRDDRAIVVALVAHDALVAERFRLADAPAVQNQRVRRLRPFARRQRAAQLLSTSTGSSDVAMPMRFDTRSTWRSTGSPGTPSAWPRTTFAVFRPTPGSSTSASIVLRHLAAVMLDERARHSHQRLRLRSEEARRVNQRFQLFRRRLRKCGGVGIALEQRGVTRLTPASVDCAERIVATSS